MKNNIFLYLLNNHESIINIKTNEIITFSQKNKFTMKITTNILDFICKYNFNFNDKTKNIEFLVLNYWFSILLIYKHNKGNSGWSDSTFKAFVTSTTRILELLSYLINLNNDELNEIYLSEYIINDQINYYYNFLKILDKGNKVKNFNLLKIKNVNYIVFDNLHEKDEINYVPHFKVRSTIPIQPSRNDQKNYLAYYFKLNNKYVNEIYLLTSSDNIIEGRNSAGQWGDKIPFEVIDTIKIDTISFGKKENVSIETDKEYKLRKKTIQSPLFDKKTSDLINENFYDIALENNIESSYKRYKISRAISNTITKKNLDLMSEYAKPEVECLRSFLKYLFDSNHNKTLEKNLICLTILLGININKLIAIILNIDTQIRFNKNKEKIRIQLNKSIFASDILSVNIAEKTSKQECEIYLNEVMCKIWLETKRELWSHLLNYINIDRLKSIRNEKKIELELTDQTLEKIVNTFQYTSNFDEFNSQIKQKFNSDVNKSLSKIDFFTDFVDHILSQLNTFFKNQITTYPKKIVLNFNSLSTLSLHYYKAFNSQSDISLLYSQSITKNDEARACYGTIRERLVNTELWMKKFSEILNIKDYFSKNYTISHQINKPNESKNWVGSPYYVKTGAFKNFILALDRLNLTNEIDKVNVVMIFLRYSFSILLGTRDFNNSCNLNNYSKRLKVLFIQEKGKNIYTGKRVIPLTDRALKYISIFEKIKEKHNILSSSPIILRNKKEYIINKDEIKNFCKSIENEENKENLEIIENFVFNVKVNFGRHIATSCMSASNLKSNYLDAYLNHYKMGSEDQGIYSNFDNDEYINEIKNKLNIMEQEYFPDFIKVENYVY